MDTSNRNLPDENFTIIQNKLKYWMQAKGIVTWKQIQRACRELLMPYPENYVTQYGNYPEYKIFMPLLRKGECEIAQQNGKTGFICFSKSEYLENVMNPLLLLNNFPEIQSLIKQYQIENTIELKVCCDLENSYSYKSCNSENLKVGIYKAEDKVYSPAFLFDGKEKRMIPGYEKNIDAINVARCYVRSVNEKTIFFFHRKRKILNTAFYSDLPILITRALFLLCEEYYKDPDFNYPINYHKDFEIIDEKVINELIRIFGKSSVEVIDD